MKIPKINIYAVMGWIAIGIVFGACGMISLETNDLITDKGDENLQWARNPLPFWIGVVMIVTGLGWFVLDWLKKDKP